MILRGVGVFLALTAPALVAQSGNTTVYEMGEVQEKPQVLSTPATANYRGCMQDAGLRGTEGLEFVVDTTGHVEGTSVDVLQSTDAILDSVAVEDVRVEQFRAGRMGGHPVRVRVQQPFKYGVYAPPPAKGDSGVFPLSCLDERPAILKGAAVQYPEDALGYHRGGTVWTAFAIDTEGHVIGDTVTITSKRDLFDGPVREMLTGNRTTFRPGRIFGHPVVTRVRMAVTFRVTCDPAQPTHSTDPDVLDGITVTACQR